MFWRSPFAYGASGTWYNSDGSLYSPYQLVLPEPSWMKGGNDGFVESGTRQVATAPSALERAEFLLRYGEEDRAADAYREHLASTPNDHAAERGLAMVLLEQGKTEEAVALLVMAYQNQPTLARQAINTDILPGGVMDHRRRFNRVMTYANRVKTSSGYFAASVLAQSEGRGDIARRLLEKANAAGLDKKIADEMNLALPAK
jgi:tetratricopeptide (TPR) repeat protein